MRPLHYERVRAYKRNTVIAFIMAAFVAGAVFGAAWAHKQKETYQRYETNSSRTSGR